MNCEKGLNCDGCDTQCNKTDLKAFLFLLSASSLGHHCHKTPKQIEFYRITIPIKPKELEETKCHQTTQMKCKL